MDRLEMVLKGLECCGVHDCENCPFDGCVGDRCIHRLTSEALELLKEKKAEHDRTMKIIWDTLHEGLSIDTEPDQDWVYEQIRHRIEDT